MNVFTVLILVWWAWGVLYWGDRLTAGFADVLRQKLLQLHHKTGKNSKIWCESISRSHLQNVAKFKWNKPTQQTKFGTIFFICIIKIIRTVIGNMQNNTKLSCNSIYRLDHLLVEISLTKIMLLTTGCNQRIYFSNHYRALHQENTCLIDNY